MTAKTQVDVAEHVSKCLQLAVLLEVSAYPKPGNVHRTADFKETIYEHFLASAVALAPSFRSAAQKGVLMAQGKLNLDELEIGKIIKDAVEQVKAWQSGGNTLLGTIILLTPIAVAAGKALIEESFSISRLRKNVKLVARSTTPIDAVKVYEAISIVEPGGLGKAPKLDVADPASKQKILRDNVTLFDVFEISSSWDSISSEWVNNYSITFGLGYPYFVVPDTLVARKMGSARAKEISIQAKKVLEAGALTTQKGREKLFQFDNKLRDAMHQLNPGTTADLTAAVLAVSVLDGYKP